MGVTIEWKGDQFLKRVEVAAEKALDSTTVRLASIMEISMRTSITVAPGTAVEDQPPSAPGTPPAPKSGVLAGSMTNAKVGTLRWAAGTNVAYARIQEFGGTINHTGGTAYLSFGGKAVFVKNMNAKSWMRRTGAHTITLPARPFMRPALNNNRKLLGAHFNREFKQFMGAGV